MRNGRAKRAIFRETKREKEENIYISTTAEETARPVQLERERERGEGSKLMPIDFVGNRRSPLGELPSHKN